MYLGGGGARARRGGVPAKAGTGGGVLALAVILYGSAGPCSSGEREVGLRCSAQGA